MLVVGLLGGAAAMGVYGLFTGTTQNTGNELTSGTVSFTDNDNGAALYNAGNFKPGDTVTKCIKATYTGSLPATVRMYSASSPGPLAQYLDLTITQGTTTSSTFPDCTGFAATGAGQLFTGTLQNFEQTRNTYATGLATAPGAGTTWSASNTLVYRVQATLQSTAPDTAQGTSSGVHTFTWEARSQ
ncbi:MAG: hypothetical protein QOI31_1955 [Solirubrobacterales bacterium]|jgi:hypothetical protein|nr:hypothetical protein [Solirubrobacterales bacterium]